MIVQSDCIKWYTAHFKLKRFGAASLLLKMTSHKKSFYISMSKSPCYENKLLPCFNATNDSLKSRFQLFRCHSISLCQSETKPKQYSAIVVQKYPNFNKFEILEMILVHFVIIISFLHVVMSKIKIT